jgi:ATP-dependent DNA helicase DinG
MSKHIDSILGVDGSFSKESSTYQPRTQQIDMANSVELALNSGKHAIIEAGTGTGKTFAYLVPTINHSITNHVKIVISTKTKNLQSQILTKDIPFLERILESKFKTEKIVGIGNYICFHRLMKYLNSDNIEDIKELRKIVSFYCVDQIRFSKIHELSKVKRNLVDYDKEEENPNVRRLNSIMNESEEVDDYENTELEAGAGTKEEYSEPIDPKLWTNICAESDSCHRKSCNFFDDCFYFKAKERQKDANVLVVNHALFFADLAVRKASGFCMENAVIPKYDVVVFDEAHDIENVAANFMGIQVSNYKIKHFIGTLVSNINNNKTLRSIVGIDSISSMAKIVEEITVETVSFFNEIREKFARNEISKVCRVEKPFFADCGGLIACLKKVESSLLSIIRSLGCEIEDGKIEIGSAKGNEEVKDLKVFIERTSALINDLDKLVSMSDKDWAYWVDISEKKIAICGSPVDVARELRDNLFSRIRTCILTSATIAVNNSFEFIADRIGIENLNDSVQLIVGSPFNYERQAMICIPGDSIEPTVYNNDLFAEKVSEQIKEIVKISSGRAFVLFTSYKLMNDVYSTISEELEDWGYPVFRQSSNCSREKLLEKFMENDNSILFGAESFWQGVDVPGEKLSCVIIPKIPFANPSEPLVAARMDLIKKRGLNPFITYSLPDSILRLKQGTGRLIRRETDKGIVVILDKRILTKGYGHKIIKSLPNYYQTKNIEDLKLVFNE